MPAAVKKYIVTGMKRPENYNVLYVINVCRNSSVGRASDWRSEGHWFNPGFRHAIILNIHRVSCLSPKYCMVFLMQLSAISSHGNHILQFFYLFLFDEERKFHLSLGIFWVGTKLHGILYSHFCSNRNNTGNL